MTILTIKWTSYSDLSSILHPLVLGFHYRSSMVTARSRGYVKHIEFFNVTENQLLLAQLRLSGLLVTE